jgi:acyl-CoA synthetase (AMP-forming)/AMP-acid ligase II
VPPFEAPGPVAPGVGAGFSGFNLGVVFETLAGALSERELLVGGGRRLSYGELAERSRRLASYLAGHGLGCHTPRAELAGHQSGQDHVALALYNGNEYLEGMIGSYRARAAPFNVNYRYVEDELRYLLTDATPAAVIYHASLAPRLRGVLGEVPSVRVLLQVADDAGHDLLPGAVDYEEALRISSPDGPATEPSPDDLYILYTGGTTGMPKGVLWRQHDIFMAAMGGRRVGTWEEVADYGELAAHATTANGLTLMLLPPLMHGAAQWAGFMMMTEGSRIVLPDDTRRLDPADVWRTVEREGVNTLTVVGDAMVRPLLAELDRGSYDTTSLVAIGNGGAALTPAVRELALARLPSLLILDTAGSSETGAQMNALTSGTSDVLLFNPGPGTVVVDETFGRELEPGHPGIGWLAQSGWVPLGYLGDADKTARTFPVVDGVRYSIPGDRARVMADGRIELLGRDSVCVNSGGEKIFVEEVERAIASHPAVADVVVAGRPSERWGQEVVAVVQLSAPGAADRDDIVAHAARHVARYKLPKAVVFVPLVERSPSGKADYRWAAARAAEA